MPKNSTFEDEFLRFLKHLQTAQLLKIESAAEGNFDVKPPEDIVLLGDFLDLWDGHLADMPKFVMDVRVLNENANIFYLRGNHDYLVPPIDSKGTRSFSIEEWKTLEISGKEFFFIHGHQFWPVFGESSLRVESYVNPLYTVMEGFLSRPLREKKETPNEQGNDLQVEARGEVKRGKIALVGIALVFFALSVILGLGMVPAFPSVFLVGLLSLPALVTIWRWVQKPVYGFIRYTIAEPLKRWFHLRGTVRGDRIANLTARDGAIYRWFHNKSDDLDIARESAKRAKFVLFGHTHFPEGPKIGKDLDGITFLNTGSWLKPGPRRRQDYAKSAAYISRKTKAQSYSILSVPFAVLAYFLGEYFGLVPALPFVPDKSFVAYLQSVQIPSFLIGISGIVAALLFGSTVVSAYGKSSYSSLSPAGYRSLAYIGKTPNGDCKPMLLYWNPAKKVLTDLPPRRIYARVQRRVEDEPGTIQVSIDKKHRAEKIRFASDELKAMTSEAKFHRLKGKRFSFDIQGTDEHGCLSCNDMS